MNRIQYNPRNMTEQWRGAFDFSQQELPPTVAAMQKAARAEQRFEQIDRTLVRLAWALIVFGFGLGCLNLSILWYLWKQIGH
jgi:hypothetical protein